MSEINGLPPADTSPETALPVPNPIPIPSSISTPPALPSPQTLRSWLPLYLSKTDSTLTHLSKILSTPSGTDVLLCTLCYSTLLTSNLISRFSIHQIRSTARVLIEKAITLPPNTTLFIPTSAIPTPSPSLILAAARLKALSGAISDFRTFGRLWGLLGIYKWAKGAFASKENGGERDGLVRKITQIQVLACAAYQILENGAYLSGKGVLGWSKERQGKAWLWSVRCWMVHVGLDILRLGYEYRKKEKLRKIEGEKGVEEREREHGEWLERWWKSLIVNCAYAPLTVHWSMEGGLVTEFWVGLLGTVAGGTGLRHLWRHV
ncbi:peroxin 11c protein [Rutstroemia sp. NJR-2017a BBW]|nr:peroxin 11c protein [Rutstroemia sp. NJR-2017a BBW]